MENERKAWIFLNRIPELGPVRFHRLLHAAQSAEGILDLSVSGLQAADVSHDLAEQWHRAFRDPKNQRGVDAELERLSKGDCHLVTELDEGYPSLLRELYGRPPVLYYKGRWPPPGVGVVGLVGTRQPSEYGRSIAERLATDLSFQGVATISGLARGIDSCVHQASLQAGGYTLAVLGCGLGQVYPRENAALQSRIAESGALVSEFPYDTSPDPRHFPRRNRIISGLSQGVVVIEAGVHSGALITARYAAEQGRDVFAVPGSVFHNTSAGCHRLIKEGAKLVEHAADILDELGVQAVTPADHRTDALMVDGLAPMNEGSLGAGVQSRTPMVRQTSGGDEVVFDKLTVLEKHIVQLLSGEPLSADELLQGTAQRFEQVANSLLSLELKGIIRTLPGQRYVKN